MVRLPKATAWEHGAAGENLVRFPFHEVSRDTEDERLLWPKELALDVCLDGERLPSPLEWEGLVWESEGGCVRLAVGTGVLIPKREGTKPEGLEQSFSHARKNKPKTPFTNNSLSLLINSVTFTLKRGV